MADRPGGGYRDELGAAHARIAELEARLRDRERLGEGSRLLPRLRAQRTTIERRVRENHVLTRVAAFGAVVWFALGLLVQGSARAGSIVPMIAALCAYVAMSAARRERQLKSDGTVLDENIAEAEQLFARVEDRPTTVRVEVAQHGPVDSPTAESTAEPERADERRDDHHEHPGSMRAR